MTQTFKKERKKTVLPKVTQRPTELRSLLKPLSPTTASPSLLPRFPLVHSMLSLPFLNDPPVCQSTVRLQQQPCRSIAGEGCRSDASMLGSRLPGTEASCTWREGGWVVPPGSTQCPQKPRNHPAIFRMLKFISLVSLSPKPKVCNI